MGKEMSQYNTYVNGNVAKKIYSDERNFKNNKKIKKAKKKSSNFTLLVICLICIIGITIIMRYSSIYNLQRKMTNLDIEISNIKEENEALQIKILKNSSLTHIQESAGKQLKMKMSTINDSIKIDFSENYFKDIKVEELK